MNIENEYKQFNDYWNETIKSNSWTTLERQACFMGWIAAKERALNLYNVGGSLRELADKYEINALKRYEEGEHALSHLHMAAHARYGFEDGWNAAKKQ